MRTTALIALALASACSPHRPARIAPPPDSLALPDVRTAPGRPPVVLVSRDGDPAAAVAVAVTTSSIGWADATADDPEPATALAGIVEARLRQKGIDANVTPSWDGLRASALATSESEAVRVTGALHEALASKVEDADVPTARKKLAALGQRPLRDRALRPWARCVGQPYALVERAGKDYGDVDAALLERWRAQAAGLGRVALAVTGPAALGEAAARAILQGAEWSTSLPERRAAARTETAVDVYETSALVVHATIDVGTSSAAVTTAEALGDPRGPLAARLSELELPFQLREVTGGAHAQGGCVGVVLGALSAPDRAADLGPRVADAVALVQLEANVHLGERGAARDGRTLARRSGDAREAAERAAWWALVDQTTGPRSGGSVALGVPPRRTEGALEPSREALAESVVRARAAWERPVIDAKSRIEAGQGEAWVLVGSPCGTEGEADDAGLSALFVTAASNASGAESIEPWIATDGAGVLVHGPPLPGETPAAHARRLADVAARSFAAEPIGTSTIARARTDLLRRDLKGDGPAISLLANVLAPQHPSWIVPWGTSEPLARSSDGAVLMRAAALRGGPMRIAVLANADAAQAEAAIRAADRWVARHSGEARSCRPASAALPPKPGTYAAIARPGALPEVYLAFPFPTGDEPARASAQLVATALEGGLLDRALDTLAHEASAKVLGWPRAPALVVRVVAAQATLDGAVMQARALVDRLHQNGVPDLEKVLASRTRHALAAALDPRARIVATWRGEGPPRAASAAEVREFTQRYLAEDAMVVVASRPPRPTPP